MVYLNVVLFWTQAVQVLMLLLIFFKHFYRASFLIGLEEDLQVNQIISLIILKQYRD